MNSRHRRNSISHKGADRADRIRLVRGVWDLNLHSHAVLKRFFGLLQYEACPGTCHCTTVLIHALFTRERSGQNDAALGTFENSPRHHIARSDVTHPHASDNKKAAQSTFSTATPERHHAGALRFCTKVTSYPNRNVPPSPCTHLHPLLHSSPEVVVRNERRATQLLPAFRAAGVAERKPPRDAAALVSEKARS